MLKVSHSIKNTDTGHHEAKQTEPYVVFTVDDEKFGVEAKKTLELVKYSKPLEMPHNFVNVQGMSNFRGKLVPIVDLRRVFGLEPIDYGSNTVIIIIDSGSITFGITAERVLDLLMVPVNLIKQIDNFNFGEKTKYLKSVANFGDQMILLLNLDKIIETKPAPAMSESPELQSLFKAEPEDVPDILTQENEGKASSLEKVFMEAQEAYPSELSVAEPKLSQEAEPMPVIEIEEESPKITEETVDQVCINDDSGMVKEELPDYLIAPQELRKLLNEAALNSWRETEGSGAPETDYETQNHADDLLAPSEIDRILAEIEQENKGEGEKLQVKEDDAPAEGFTKAGLDGEPSIAVAIPEVSSGDILKPEQIDEIFSSLQKETVLDLPEESFHNYDEITIDLDLTDHWLSDQVIDNILKELETKAGPKPGDSFGSGDNQGIKIEGIEAPEEKPDV